MSTVAEFLAQLSDDERHRLTEAIQASLRDVRLAARCLTEPGPQAHEVAQFLACLTRALGQLETAQKLVRRRA
jgi:hypothetical protein